MVAFFAKHQYRYSLTKYSLFGIARATLLHKICCKDSANE